MLKNKIKTIFIGTPDFGIPSFESIINDSFFDILCVITQPDKKIGRKQILTSPPIKQLAQKHNIPVFQPDKIKKFDIPFKDPDLIIVIAYAQIIPESILNLPKYGCINMHGSLLPKYRGASCIQASILNGDKKTGITIMKMDKGLDTGAMLHKEEIIIHQNDTTGTLFDKLSVLGGKIITPIIKQYISGKIIPQPQNESLASYVGMLKKENGKINWYAKAKEVERFVRAMSPWPGSYSLISNIESEIKNVKIVKVKNKPIPVNKYKIGEIFINNNNLAIQTGEDSLVIEELQLEGKKIMSAKEFINGYKQFIGNVLS